MFKGQTLLDVVAMVVAINVLLKIVMLCLLGIAQLGNLFPVGSILSIKGVLGHYIILNSNQGGTPIAVTRYNLEYMGREFGPLV